MIELQVPVEQIPYIRTIEGRQFHDGKWWVPEVARYQLMQLGLLPKEHGIPKTEEKQFELSDFLWTFQKNIVNKTLNAGSFGIFADTGTGKTVMGLELARHYNKTLILCPLSVIETAWIDDCRRFFPSKSIINCWDKGKLGRIKKLNTPADIYVMNYDSFKILKNRILKAGFDCMIVDESSVMKNMSSQITSAILDFTTVIPHRFVLSGCPTPNHNSEIYPQMKFVGNVFGNNYYGFLARYFHQDMANPHVWYQTDEDKERYFSKLSGSSIFIKKEDCIDLPDKVFEIRKFDMAKEQRIIYDGFLNDIVSHINEWSKFEFTAKLMKLREVASGFTIQKDGSINCFENNKDKLLEETIAEIKDRPIIVWCQFNHECESLAAKFGGVALTSKTKNRDDVIRQFKNGEINLLFAHPKLIGKGLTFVNCTYNIYYSLSYSYEEYKQSQDRIHRAGQDSKCTYIFLQANDSIEERIYDCVQRKGNAVDELYMEMGLKT